MPSGKNYSYRLNPGGTPNLEFKEIDPDSKEFLKKIRVSRIANLDISVYNIPGIGRKKNRQTAFQKQ